MKSHFFISLLLLCAVFCPTAMTATQATADYEIIPLPAEIIPDRAKGFVLNNSTVISIPRDDEALAGDARHLASYIKALTGLDLKVTTGKARKNVIALQASLANDNPEAYEITVSPTAITINGASTAGTFYGIQTLRKSIPADAAATGAEVVFPAVTIKDAPRFSYRGAHLDVARHFFPADSVKAFIDMLALHNINKFHWHLTDDQGWRVEIKSRPALAEKASMRKCTVIGHNSGRYDGKPYGGYYTQEQIRDIIDYAADRHITVIPEIDLPGHMLAALSAYPELGCTGGDYQVWPVWGIADDVLCAGNDATYRFIDDVLGEIVDLFPSEYVHVGGDECPTLRWAVCDKCQQKIHDLGLTDDEHSTKEQKLQSHMMKHAVDFLASKGRKMIGWDEIMEGGLAPGAIVMSWRGVEGGRKAAEMGHDAIMTPTDYMYFNFYQTRDTENEPDAFHAYVLLDKVYSYDPRAGVDPAVAHHIIGVQANLWSEYIDTFGQAQYMALPRYGALAEVQWCDPAGKDYDAFLARLNKLVDHYRAAGYRYSTHGLR